MVCTLEMWIEASISNSPPLHRATCRCVHCTCQPSTNHSTPPKKESPMRRGQRANSRNHREWPPSQCHPDFLAPVSILRKPWTRILTQSHLLSEPYSEVKICHVREQLIYNDQLRLVHSLFTLKSPQIQAQLAAFSH